MGRLAVDRDRKIAAARPCARKRAVWQGRFIGERRHLALGEFGNQPSRGVAAGFFIRIDQHIIADARRKRGGFDRAQGGQDDRNPAFHICRAGAIEDPILKPFQGLERMIDGKDCIHMARQQHLYRRVGPDAEMKMLAALDTFHRSVGQHGFHRIGLRESDVSRQGGKSIGEQS